jgi:hypothetical protein
MKLTKLEQRWAHDVLSGFAPTNGTGLAPRPGEVDFSRIFVRIYGASTALARFGQRVALLIAVFAPLWMCGKLALIGSVPLAERAKIIDRLLDHRVFMVRELMVLLKITASFALLGSPAVRARSNYDNPAAVTNARSNVESSGVRSRALPVIQDGRTANKFGALS